MIKVTYDAPTYSTTVTYGSVFEACNGMRLREMDWDYIDVVVFLPPFLPFAAAV